MTQQVKVDIIVTDKHTSLLCQGNWNKKACLQTNTLAYHARATKSRDDRLQTNAITYCDTATKGRDDSYRQTH